MSLDAQSKSDLLHDFQSELHAILNAVELVNENLHSDPEYVEEAMEAAGPKVEILREKWKQVRITLIDKKDGS